jgi:hypothetical protein
MIVKLLTLVRRLPLENLHLLRKYTYTIVHSEKIVLKCEILVIYSTPRDKMYKAEDFTVFMTTVKTELKTLDLW